MENLDETLRILHRNVAECGRRLANLEKMAEVHTGLIEKHQVGFEETDRAVVHHNDRISHVENQWSRTVTELKRRMAAIEGRWDDEVRLEFSPPIGGGQRIGKALNDEIRRNNRDRLDEAAFGPGGVAPLVGNTDREVLDMAEQRVRRYMEGHYSMSSIDGVCAAVQGRLSL